MSNNVNVKYDLPISSSTEDKFSRRNFANGISQTIIDWTDSSGYTIGIYGGWGEGKSSILNMIGERLKKEEKIVVINYNPWRFSGENELLLGFFNTLADSLDQELKSKSEKIGTLIKGYADVVLPSLSFFGVSVDLAKSVKGLGEKLSEINIESVKSKIAKILEEQQKKVVIIIDDVDRLEKKEMQALFKLVKLNADFKYITYILSFDDQVVAHALGEVYGKGDKEAGYEYLEKIIQVPLRVPKATNESLSIFALEIIEKIFKLNNFNIHELDRQWIRSFFEDYFLPYITTPRTIVRYSNVLSFSLSLMPSNEICIIDLFVIEGIKIFYPELHKFIQENPIYFLGYIDENKSYSEKDENKGALEAQIDTVLGKYDLKHHINAKSILAMLFPKCFSLLKYQKDRNPSIQDLLDKDYGYNHKRIYSVFFFERYFTLTVTNEEVPQAIMNVIFALVDYENAIDPYIDDCMSNYGAERVIKRLQSEIKTTEISIDGAFNLLKALEKHIDIFKNSDKTFFSKDIDLYNEFIDFGFDLLKIKSPYRIISLMIKNKYNYEVINNLIYKLRFYDLTEKQFYGSNKEAWMSYRSEYFRYLEEKKASELSAMLFSSIEKDEEFDLYLSKFKKSTWSLISILLSDPSFGEPVALSFFDASIKYKKSNINYFLLMFMGTYGISYSEVRDKPTFCNSQFCEKILSNINLVSDDLEEYKKMFIKDVEKHRTKSDEDQVNTGNKTNSESSS